MQSILFADTAKHFLEINGIHVHAQTVDTRLSFPPLQQRGYEVTTTSHFVVAYLTVLGCVNTHVGFKSSIDYTLMSLLVLCYWDSLK